MYVCILLSAILLLLLGSWYAYSVSFFAPRNRRTAEPLRIEGDAYEAVGDDLRRISHIMQRIPYEAVSIQSKDGLKLYGRYYHQRDGAPVEILFHGYRSHPYRDCSGGHALARKMGFNILVVDQRSHGQSEGRTITFGIRERMDCLCWIQYLNERFGADNPVILSGLSMGAATVLMAADQNLPENVACILADSPYSAPAAIIEKVCTDRHYPVPLCRPLLHLGARLYGGFRLQEADALRSVKGAKIPILLIHGEADDFVPCAMSIEIAAQCASPVTLVTFPDADHGMSYMVDPVRYETVVYRFLSEIPQVGCHITAEYIRGLSEIQKQ